MDIDSIISLFAPEGVWAVLSFILIYYIIKAQERRDIKQDEREEKYQNIIADLTESLKDINEIKEIITQKLR